jgi:hypothetical protein
MSMKIIGLIIVLMVFLAGAFLSVLDPEAVAWNWMVPVLFIGGIGLWMHRKASHAEDRSDDKLAGNMDTLQSSLERILHNLEDMDARKLEIPVYEARFEIDHLFREDLNLFAEARESMIHVFGMQQFADVMSSFAAGERYINRIWSASTDGYEDEVRKFISRARDQFTEAVALFRRLRAEADMDPAVASA